MADKDFDDRYPTMFQPGGEQDSATAAAPNSQLERSLAPTFADESPIQLPATELDTEKSAGQEPTSSSLDSAAKGIRGLLVPLSIAVLMVASGLFALTAQYLVRVQSDGTTVQGGVFYATWSNDLVAAAPVLITAGLGTATAALLLETRRKAWREDAGRVTLGIAAGFIGVIGLLCLYAPYLFPEQADFNAAMYDGTPRRSPWPWAVAPTGLWLVTLASLLVALRVLISCLQTSKEEVYEHNEPLANREVISAKRALWFGALAILGGVLVLMAPHIIPPQGVMPRAIPATSDVPWQQLVQPLSIPLLVTGAVILGIASVVRIAAVKPMRGSDMTTEESA